MPQTLVAKMFDDEVKGLKPSEELVSFVHGCAGHASSQGFGGFHSFSRTFNFHSLSQNDAIKIVEKAQKAFSSPGVVLAGGDGGVSYHFSAKDLHGNNCKYSVKMTPEGNFPNAENCRVSASLFVATRDRDTGNILARVAEALLSEAMMKASQQGAKIFKKHAPDSGPSARVFSESVNYGVEYA